MDEMRSSYVVIKDERRGINLQDDESYLWKLEIILGTTIIKFGGFSLSGIPNHIVVQGVSLEALERYIGNHKLRQHPQLKSGIITGPNGFQEDLIR